MGAGLEAGGWAGGTSLARGREGVDGMAADGRYRDPRSDTSACSLLVSQGKIDGMATSPVGCEAEPGHNRAGWAWWGGGGGGS